MLAQLHVRTVNTEDHVIEVIGTVSDVDAPCLAEALVQFDAGDVIVDLSAVATVDRTGVRALTAAQRHIERRHGQLILRGANHAVRDALEGTTLRTASARENPTDESPDATGPPVEAVHDLGAPCGHPRSPHDPTAHVVPVPEDQTASFFVDTSRVADAFVLRLVGELDLQFASAAKHASIAALPQAGHDAVSLTLDLSGLTFCDASGIRVIVQLARAAAARGYDTVLRNPKPNVRRVLNISRLDTWLAVEDTREPWPMPRSSDSPKEM